MARGSIRGKGEWLNKYPTHQLLNLRGNVNTRLKKLETESWDAAIFAQAGLERIHLRPANSLVLDWMLPAPAQGAILIVCRQEDEFAAQACQILNDPDRGLCTRIERNFLSRFRGRLSPPMSALPEA